MIIDKRQATKAENKQVLIFPDQTFGSAKAKNGGNCLPLRDTRMFCRRALAEGESGQ
jgi:hypothetical protein